MNVLVAGGKGFIGRHCADALRTAGHSVRILARGGGQGQGIVKGDITQPDSLPQALDGIEAVVHCVGLIVEPAGMSFESVVRDGTRNLVDACTKTGVKQIVYISALGTRPNAPSRYHQTKWLAEEAIRNSGLNFTIFRPSIVFGPGDEFINKFLRMPFIPLPGGGNGLFQPIFVKDVAALVNASLTNPVARNRTFDAGGPEQMTHRKMMATALEVAGKRKPMIPVPMTALKLVSTVSDPMQKCCLPLAPVTKDQYIMMQEPNIGDNTALHAAFLDIRLTPLREGLATYLGKGR